MGEAVQLNSQDVFGVSNRVSEYSYVDRGNLDEALARHLKRPNHVALKGASKAGKSWLRQTVIKESLVVQCRWGKTVEDIYREALHGLGVRLEISRSRTSSLSGSVEASTEVGVSLIGKVLAKLSGTVGMSTQEVTEGVQHPVEDVRFIAELLIESGRRLVVEDFHYLSKGERVKFAFDLKAFWDLGLFVVIIGVWSESNLLLHLNPDLTGRVREESVVWSSEDLGKVLERGGAALNVEFSSSVRKQLVRDSCENVGILQRLALEFLDRCNVHGWSSDRRYLDSVESAEEAALFYAEELNTVYQTFASGVASGVRVYPNSTGIYGHAMAVIFDASDEELVQGVSVDRIYETAHARQPRVQKGNLRSALEKFEQLQVDDAGRGLVLSYADDKVRVVDRQLLLYRRYCTVRWPWENLIEAAEADEKERFSSVIERD